MNTKVTDDVLPPNNHRQLAQNQPSFLKPSEVKDSLCWQAEGMEIFL